MKYLKEILCVFVHVNLYLCHSSLRLAKKSTQVPHFDKSTSVKKQHEIQCQLIPKKYPCSLIAELNIWLTEEWQMTMKTCCDKHKRYLPRRRKYTLSQLCLYEKSQSEMSHWMSHKDQGHNNILDFHQTPYHIPLNTWNIQHILYGVIL